MARIAGVQLPKEKKVEYGLCYLYGVGLTVAKKIVAQAGIDSAKRIKELSAEEENKLREIIEKGYKVEGDLRREILMNIKRLKEIGAYRGTRHAKGLPARGQRTRTNSRTVRGNVRKTMGSGRKKATEKT